MEIIKDFLTKNEVYAFQWYAKESSHWKPGRQKTGYEVICIKRTLTFLSPIMIKIKSVMLPATGDFWDLFLIRYPDGSYIPPHKDQAEIFGQRHQRLNALLKAPDSGGQLRISGDDVHLEIGDAVLFFPDEEEHEVTKVQGERLLLSSGLWTEKNS